MPPTKRALSRWGHRRRRPAAVVQACVRDVFGDDADVVLDIGFGAGEALIELAEVRPNEYVIGIDVHTPGIAAVLAEVERRACATYASSRATCSICSAEYRSDRWRRSGCSSPIRGRSAGKRGRRRLIRPDVVTRFVRRDASRRLTAPGHRRRRVRRTDEASVRCRINARPVVRSPGRRGGR